MGIKESDSNAYKPRLETAHLNFRLKDHYAIRDLNLLNEKYDGSPVDCVIVGKNGGGLVVHLINQDRISDFLSHPRKVPTSAWELKKIENKEKVIRYLSAEFLLGQ